MSRSSAFVLVALACALGCTRGCDKPTSAPAKTRDSADPPTQAEVPTTNGKIAWENFETQIRASEKLATNLEGKLNLDELILTRTLYTNRVADLERALALAEECVKDSPSSADAHLARASALSALHLFSRARDDLAKADELHADPAALRRVRASILQAEGALDEALVVRHAQTTARADIVSLGAEAALIGEMGKSEEAHRLFRRALTTYSNVSALPVAWVLFQEAILYEREGKIARAKTFYLAAHERLPIYAHAASHLALLEKGAAGLALIEPVAASADDPEFEMILSDKLREKGDVAGADKHLAAVRARYEELLRTHPEAFAEHAGFFFLDEAKDPKRALDLAKQNLAIKKGGRAYELAVLAALAAGQKADACTFGGEAAKMPYQSPILRQAAAEACKP